MLGERTKLQKSEDSNAVVDPRQKASRKQDMNPLTAAMQVIPLRTELARKR